MIGRFEIVRDDLAGLVERVNARFGTNFQSKATKETPEPELGWHAMPNELRNRTKLDLDARFDTELAGSPALSRLVARANAVHARYRKADERAG